MKILQKFIPIKTGGYLYVLFSDRNNYMNRKKEWPVKL